MEEEKRDEINEEGVLVLPDIKKEDKHKIILHYVFMIVLIIAIFALIFATISILKYKEIIKNPIGSNLEKFNINSCKCIDNFGKSIFIPSTDYKPSNFSIT